MNLTIRINYVTIMKVWKYENSIKKILTTITTVAWKSQSDNFSIVSEAKMLKSLDT